MSKNKEKSAPRPDRMQDDAVPMPSIPSSDVGAASASKPSGYPLHILNGKVDEKFCCSYCKYILRSPMQSSCGHRFCQDCLKLLETFNQPLQCQSCVEEGVTDEDSFLDFKELFEDKAARREMKKLHVKCMYQGCPWKGTFNDFIKHEEDCDKKMVPCSQCGTSVSKARMNNHETKTCPKRVIHCNFCKEPVIYEFREKHNEECPKFLVKCEKCQTTVERYKLLVHQETVCANRIMTCPLPDCNTKLSMDKFLPHISKDENLAKHVTHLLDRSDVAEQRLQTLEDRLRLSNSNRAGTDSSFNPESSAVSAGYHAEASGSYFSEPATGADGSHGSGAQADGSGGGGGLVEGDRQKLKLHEDLMSVLHSEILRCITKGEALGRSMDKSDYRLKDCYTNIESIFVRLNTLETRLKEVSRRPFDPLEIGELSNDGPGVFTWVLRNYSQIKRDACQREREMVCSPTFFSCPGGYQLRLKLYPNGEGNENRNKNVSLFLQIIKGPNDELLLWPFSPKVHFMLVDQINFQSHHMRQYQADPMSPSTRQPVEDASVASGCPAFISVNDMNQKSPMYWPKDTVFLKFLIEMPKANMDRLDALNPLNCSGLVSS